MGGSDDVMRNRTISAHSGTGEWLLQRLTALYIAGFSLYVLLRLMLAPLGTFDAWRAWFAAGAVRVAFGLFVLSLLLHAWSGMRNVYMDYLRPLWLRFLVSFATALGLLALGLWAARLLLVGPGA